MENWGRVNKMARTKGRSRVRESDINNRWMDEKKMGVY